jgi:hypothetical protein
MADFSEHDLIMIQRWQRMHGTNQRKQGGLTPPQDGSVKASPLNKKKKKSSGVLFPSPKDTNPHTALDRVNVGSPRGEKQNSTPPTDHDINMDDEQVNDETRFQALQHIFGGDQEQAGSPTARQN